MTTLKELSEENFTADNARILSKTPKYDLESRLLQNINHAITRGKTVAQVHLIRTGGNLGDYSEIYYADAERAQRLLKNKGFHTKVFAIFPWDEKEFMGISW